MNMPEWLKPGFFGAVVGAGALAISGFAWGGWMTSSAAEKVASEQARHAVVAALVPICVEQSSQDPRVRGNARPAEGHQQLSAKRCAHEDRLGHDAGLERSRSGRRACVRDGAGGPFLTASPDRSRQAELRWHAAAPAAVAALGSNNICGSSLPASALERPKCRLDGGRSRRFETLRCARRTLPSVAATLKGAHGEPANDRTRRHPLESIPFRGQAQSPHRTARHRLAQVSPGQCGLEKDRSEALDGVRVIAADDRDVSRWVRTNPVSTGFADSRE